MGTFLRWRPKPRRYPQERVPTTFGNFQYSQPVESVLRGARNLNYADAAFSDTPKFVNTAGVANGSSVTIWTPAAGNVIELVWLTFYVSNAGAYNILYNAVTLFQWQAVVNTPVQINWPWPGYFIYPAAQALQLQNNSGAASNITVSAVGTEILA